MKNKKRLALAFTGTLLVGSLAGGCVMAVCQDRNGMAALPAGVRTTLFSDRGMTETTQYGGGMPMSRGGCVTDSCQGGVMAWEGMALLQTAYEVTAERSAYAVYEGNTVDYGGNESTYERDLYLNILDFLFRGGIFM